MGSWPKWLTSVAAMCRRGRSNRLPSWVATTEQSGWRRRRSAGGRLRTIARMNSEANASGQSAPSPDPLAGATVDEFASAGILSCLADAPLDEVAWLMAHNRVHAVVVADDEATEPPVIADVDLIAAAASGRFDTLAARDIAGTEAVSVRSDEPLDRAAQLLADHDVTHLIVRDERRVPTGILSTLDIARAISGRD